MFNNKQKAKQYKTKNITLAIVISSSFELETWRHSDKQVGRNLQTYILDSVKAT